MSVLQNRYSYACKSPGLQLNMAQKTWNINPYFRKDLSYTKRMKNRSCKNFACLFKNNNSRSHTAIKTMQDCSISKVHQDLMLISPKNLPPKKENEEEKNCNAHYISYYEFKPFQLAKLEKINQKEDMRTFRLSSIRKPSNKKGDCVLSRRLILTDPLNIRVSEAKYRKSKENCFFTKLISTAKNDTESTYNFQAIPLRQSLIES